MGCSKSSWEPESLIKLPALTKHIEICRAQAVLWTQEPFWALEILPLEHLACSKNPFPFNFQSIHICNEVMHVREQRFGLFTFPCLKAIYTAGTSISAGWAESFGQGSLRIKNVTCSCICLCFILLLEGQIQPLVALCPSVIGALSHSPWKPKQTMSNGTCFIQHTHKYISRNTALSTL